MMIAISTFGRGARGARHWRKLLRRKQQHQKQNLPFPANESTLEAVERESDPFFFILNQNGHSLES